MKTWRNSKYYHSIAQFIAYGLVGLANTVLTVILYWLFLKVCNWNYMLAFTLSWLIGVVFTYILNSRHVFRTEESTFNWANFIRYTIVYVLSYLSNTGLLWLGVSHWQFDAFWAQCVIIPIVVVMNFVGIKYWALKQ